jgi:arginine/lysine/ornithine decarboxylase
MDHTRAPVLEALVKYRERGGVSYGPPGHKQGRGIDPAVLDVVGRDVFASDVVMLNGLDDRRQSQGILTDAQRLMADAVHAEQAFFSTCGSSLSVKSTVMAVAGPGEKILLSRDAHKSVVSGFLISVATRAALVLPHGTSATRQPALYAVSGDLAAVVRNVAAETTGSGPNGVRTPPLSG